jgi:hypothetical protein
MKNKEKQFSVVIRTSHWWRARRDSNPQPSDP